MSEMVPACVKTLTSRERAELFSLFDVVDPVGYVESARNRLADVPRPAVAEPNHPPSISPPTIGPNRSQRSPLKRIICICLIG
jgi:hypothetical protein